MVEPSGIVPAHHDPLGPVSVVGDIPLEDVRDALGSGAWIERGSTRPGLALLVTTRDDLASRMGSRGIPVVLVGTQQEDGIPTVELAALPAWLTAFADGRLVSGPEAEARAWVEALRAQEKVEQERVRRTAVDAQRRAEEAEAQTRAQLDRMAAHIAAVEASRSWRAVRSIAGLKERVRRTLRRDDR